MKTAVKLNHSILVLALAAIYPLHSTAAASAGVAQFTAGDVNVRRPDGKTDPLIKGKELESGQAILTGASGRAQVRFTDGGLISLQPNTEFKIANYVDKADPKEDRFLVDLLRGSMRAITGLIGKRNHDNYKVTTTTATIGIRGSGFNAGYNPDGSLSVTTELDAIEVCNAGGCVGLTAGESVRVANATDAPVRTNVRAPVPPPDPVREVINVGDTVNSEGKAKFAADFRKDPDTTDTITDKGTVQPLPTPTNTGTFTDLYGVAHYHTSLDYNDAYGTSLGSSLASATLDSGKLTSATVSGSIYNVTSTAESKSLGSTTTNDFIGWGNWSSGTRNYNGTINVYQLHYVVGQATAALPTNPGLATWTMVGSTTPTNYLGASGTLNSAVFQVDFNTAFRYANFSASTSFGNVNESSIYFSNSTFASSNGNVHGFFSGPGAIRAGLVYNGPASGGGTFSGAAVFKK
jgi:hypothetical protein